MAVTEPKTVVGIFHDRIQAEKTREDLVQAGFSAAHIELATPGDVPVDPADHLRPSLRAKGGAIWGAVLGGCIGCLLGTLVATGVIAGATTLWDGGALAGVIGAAIGTGIGAVLGGLLGWGFSADRDSFYAWEVQGGRTLMTVYGNGRAAEAAAIMGRNLAYRIQIAAPDAKSQQ
jgi:hypothetical protein